MSDFDFDFSEQPEQIEQAQPAPPPAPTVDPEEIRVLREKAENAERFQRQILNAVAPQAPQLTPEQVQAQQYFDNLIEQKITPYTQTVQQFQLEQARSAFDQQNPDLAPLRSVIEPIAAHFQLQAHRQGQSMSDAQALAEAAKHYRQVTSQGAPQPQQAADAYRKHVLSTSVASGGQLPTPQQQKPYGQMTSAEAEAYVRQRLGRV